MLISSRVQHVTHRANRTQQHNLPNKLNTSTNHISLIHHQEPRSTTNIKTSIRQRRKSSSSSRHNSRHSPIHHTITQRQVSQRNLQLNNSNLIHIPNSHQHNDRQRQLIHTHHARPMLQRRIPIRSRWHRQSNTSKRHIPFSRQHQNTMLKCKPHKPQRRLLRLTIRRNNTNTRLLQPKHISTTRPRRPQANQHQKSRPILPSSKSRHTLYNHHTINRHQRRHLPNTSCKHIRRNLQNRQPRLSTTSTNPLPYPCPQPTMRSNHRHNTIHNRTNHTTTIPQFKACLNNLQLNASRRSSRRRSPTKRLPITPRRRIQHHYIRRHIPNSPNPILHHLSNRIPTQQLIRTTTRTNSPRSRMRIRQKRRTKTLTTSTRSTRKLPPHTKRTTQQ